MKKRLIPVLLLFCMMNASYGWCDDNTPIMLADAQKRVQSEFDLLDAGLKRAAVQLGVLGLTRDAARKALVELCGGFSYAVDCATLDPDGKMLTIEPVAYRHFEGTDISGQEQVRRVMQGQKPVFSSVFVSVEGFDAVDVEYPVTTGDGKFLGSVGLIFRPEKFLGDIIRPLVEGIPMDICAMETGGRTLYDADTQHVGQNLFSSPLFRPYPSLIELGRQIARDPSGAGKYTFPDRTTKAAVTKNAYWRTVSMYGTDWRLVGIHVESKNAEHQALPVKARNPDRPLESLAGSKVLIKALERGDRRSIMKLFRKFHKDNPGIYAIQWIDEKGINRFGYPVENSLKNYDFRAGRAQSDPELLKAVQEKKPAVFEFPLFEGNQGIFTLMPAFSGERYLGMVYVIVIK